MVARDHRRRRQRRAEQRREQREQAATAKERRAANEARRRRDRGGRGAGATRRATLRRFVQGDLASLRVVIGLAVIWVIFQVAGTTASSRPRT